MTERRRIRVVGEIAYVPLTRGLESLIDAESVELASRYAWQARKSRATTYATASVWINGKRTSLQLHRLIMNAPPDMLVDHADHDGLNNLRSNLRVCTHFQNNGNRLVSKRSITGYKGVYREFAQGYSAKIGIDNKQIRIGVFDTAEDAARAYDEAAIKQFGEFARTNAMLAIEKALGNG